MKKILDAQRATFSSGNISYQNTPGVVPFDIASSLQADPASIMQSSASIEASNDLNAIRNDIEEGLVKKTGDGLNSNIIKLTKEIRKLIKEQFEAQGRPGAPDGSIDVDETERARVRGEAEKLSLKHVERKGWGQKLKESFSLEGMFDLERSEGMLAETLKRRVAASKYAEERMTIDKPQGFLEKQKAKSKYRKQWYDINKIAGKQKKATEMLERLEESGATEEEIEKSGLHQQLNRLDRERAKVDPSYAAKRKKSREKVAKTKRQTRAADKEFQAGVLEGIEEEWSQLTPEEQKKVAAELGLQMIPGEQVTEKPTYKPQPKEAPAAAASTAQDVKTASQTVGLNIQPNIQPTATSVLMQSRQGLVGGTTPEEQATEAERVAEKELDTIEEIKANTDDTPEFQKEMLGLMGKQLDKLDEIKEGQSSGGSIFADILEALATIRTAAAALPAILTSLAPLAGIAAVATGTALAGAAPFLMSEDGRKESPNETGDYKLSKPISEMSGYERFFGRVGSKRRSIDEMVEAGHNFTPEEAADIKKYYEIDVPVKGVPETKASISASSLSAKTNEIDPASLAAPAIEPPKTADTVYGKSSEVSEGNKAPIVVNAPTNINAPTTVQGGGQAAQTPIAPRNPDSTMRDVLRDRYAR